MLPRMRSLAVLLLFAAAAARAETQHPAYTADDVVVSEGKTSRSRVASNGVITRIDSADGASVYYSDEAKHAMWMYGPQYACMQMPLAGASTKVTEEILGKEKIDGHPTTKMKVTSTVKGSKIVEIQWRATDLHDLIVRRSSEDGSTSSHLEHIVLGPPDPKRLAFPSPQCKADPSLAASVPAARGGERSIRFDQGACKMIVPLPIAMSIPSDYGIRAVPRLGCFWGAEDDLRRLLANERQADFESIRRGVFWCRVSENTEFDPVRKQFVSEMGTDKQWKKAFEASGARNVVLSSKMVGVFPTLGVTASVSGQRVYMLYLAVPNTESLAILINYHQWGREARPTTRCGSDSSTRCGQGGDEC